TTSAKRTVTSFRSPSRVARVARMRAARCAGVYDDGAGAGGVARAGAPQLSQKTASASSAEPQLAQAAGADSAVPQPRQNRASSRLSLPHCAHSTHVSYVARVPIASTGLVTSEGVL